MAQNDAKGAIASVIASAAGADAAAHATKQLELMPPTRASITDEENRRVEASVTRNRAGRPPGAKNLKTQQMLDFLRRTMGDPLMERWRWAMHTPESLSIELGCTKLEAFDRLDKIHADLARFFYAQQAQVDASGQVPVPRLTMTFGGQTAQRLSPSGAVLEPWKYLEAANAETQQNQVLLASPDSVSPSDVSPSDE